MSSSTKRQQEHNNINTTTANTDYYNHQQDQQQQHQEEAYQATIRSIDETKHNIRQAVDEQRRETPRYSQAVTDFQTQTADATQEIAQTFLDSQKEVINSFQYAWGRVVQNAQSTNNNMTTATSLLFFSPHQIADVYARTIGAFTEAYAASTRMATNFVFVGLDATRATTNYTRQNAKEAARITSNTQTGRQAAQNQ
jgi:hypothetical protein